MNVRLSRAMNFLVRTRCTDISPFNPFRHLTLRARTLRGWGGKKNKRWKAASQGKSVRYFELPYGVRAFPNFPDILIPPRAYTCSWGIASRLPGSLAVSEAGFFADYTESNPDRRAYGTVAIRIARLQKVYGGNVRNDRVTSSSDLRRSAFVGTVGGSCEPESEDDQRGCCSTSRANSGCWPARD